MIGPWCSAFQKQIFRALERAVWCRNLWHEAFVPYFFFVWSKKSRITNILFFEMKNLFEMRFRKPWLRAKLVNFDFSAKWSSIDYNESNKPSPKSLAHIRSEKSLVELSAPKNEIFTFSHFLLNWKVYFSPWAMGSRKSSITDYNESNKSNPKCLAHTGYEKSFVELGVPKNELFHFFFTFFALLKSLLFNLKPWSPKMHRICKKK